MPMFFGLEWLIITNILFPATVVAIGSATGKGEPSDGDEGEI